MTQNAVNCLQQCFTKFAKYAEIFRHLNKILPIVRGLWRDHNLKNGPEEKWPIGQKTVPSNCLHHHHHNHHHHYNYGHNWQQRCPFRCVTLKFTTTRCSCPPFYRYHGDHYDCYDHHQPTNQHPTIIITMPINAIHPTSGGSGWKIGKCVNWIVPFCRRAIALF